MLVGRVRIFRDLDMNNRHPYNIRTDKLFRIDILASVENRRTYKYSA